MNDEEYIAKMVEIDSRLINSFQEQMTIIRKATIHIARVEEFFATEVEKASAAHRKWKTGRNGGKS